MYSFVPPPESEFSSVKYARTALLTAAALTATALLAGPAPANAAVQQDYNSGECHIDVFLASHKIVFNQNLGETLTGTWTNPNNCPFQLPTKGFGNLELRANDYTATYSRLNADGTVAFDFTNDPKSAFEQDTVGSLKLAPAYIDYEYGDDGYGNPKTGYVVIDNAASQQVDSRYAGRTSLAAHRHGANVTLSATSKKYQFNYAVNGKIDGAYIVYHRPAVTFQKQVAYKVHYTVTVKGKVEHRVKIKYKWVTLKTRTGKDDGTTSLSVKAAARTKFRALSLGQTGDSQVWPSTSKSVVK